MILDEWQEKVLSTNGNICLRSGRQVGKSTIISIKAAKFAAENPGKSVMIISSVERQAFLLFDKVLDYLFRNYPKLIKKGKDRPTKHEIKLINGSIIRSLPTGLDGHGIRGYTIDLLIADEAAFIPEGVWSAVTPMLSIAHGNSGNIILLSTPFGKRGYFYDCFSDPNYTSFHISSEDCPRKNIAYLEQERKRMTKLQYAQEYLGEFVDELRQFFPTELIKSCMTLSESPSFSLSSPKAFYLGVDVARMGSDESVLFSVVLDSHEKLEQVEMVVTNKSYLTETTKLIKEQDKKYNYKRIYIDDGGLGVGVFDPLLADEQTRRKVVAINNSSRSLDRDGKQKKKLLKEDLYNNLLYLMQSGKIKFYEDADIMLSLKSVQAEYDNGQLKIFGSYTHIAEAIIRAAWCMKDKSLNIWIA